MGSGRGTSVAAVCQLDSLTNDVQLDWTSSRVVSELAASASVVLRSAKNPYSLDVEASLGIGVKVLDLKVSLSRVRSVNSERLTSPVTVIGEPSDSWVKVITPETEESPLSTATAYNRMRYRDCGPEWSSRRSGGTAAVTRKKEADSSASPTR